MDPSKIELRSLVTRAELQACVDLQRETWGATFSDVVPLSILKVTQRIGGVVAGAFAPDGALLGFVFGMTGVERDRIVHWSDMLAVRPEARNLGLGRRLKEFQRHTVRALGAEVVYWTYDPLIARNAHLNFNKLGARLAEYVEDMYGVTDSVLHGGLPTDRVIIAWSTRDDEIAHHVSEAERALASHDCVQSPVVTAEWTAEVAGAAILPHCVRVEVPLEAERLLLESPSEAQHWRLSVRFGLQWGLAAGYSVTAMQLDSASARGYYLMTRTNPVRSSNSNGRL